MAGGRKLSRLVKSPPPHKAKHSGADKPSGRERPARSLHLLDIGETRDLGVATWADAKGGAVAASVQVSPGETM